MGQTTTLRLRFDAFDLDEADARLRRDGKPIALPPKAFGVLCALARQPGVLVTKNALLDAVWGHQHVSESVLKTTISQVRAALADDAASPRYIETASRLGYRFIGAAQADRPAVAANAVSASPSGERVAAEIPEGFIGRRDALAKLQECWQRAQAGQRQLLWVAGDAGVGKSTLLETFVRSSHAAVIAQGQCVEQYGSGEPYLPVLQALGDLCREYPALATAMRTAAPTWLLQLPWLSSDAERAALTRELVGVSQERMVREFHELMSRFTADRPMLIVIEDLHWSDEATLALINHFARQRGPARVLWIGSFRLTQVIAEGHPLQGLRQELRLQRLAQEILLDPFSEAEVLSYLKQRAPVAEAPEAFVRRVHSHTDGLPLFVVNVVDALLGGDVDSSASSRHRVSFAANSPLPVPEDLMGAVETRIGRLSAERVTLLESAGIIGVEFRAGAVAEMCGRPLAEVIGVCDELVKKQFWLRHSATVDLNDGTLDALYTFKHAIYRHVFYERIGAAARVQLHRRAAQVLAAGAARGVMAAPAELASHHERGREPGAALLAYSQAAQLALRSFAPRQALDLCEHALTLLPHIPPGPQQLMLELGVQSPRGTALALLHGVGAAEPRSAFERVRELCELLPQHPARAILLNGYCASLYSRGEYGKLAEFAQKMEKLEGPDRAPLQVMTALFYGGSFSARGKCRDATEWFLKAIGYCEAIKDRTGFQPFVVDPEVGIRANAVRTLFERGLYDQAREQARRSIAIAMEIGQPLAQVLARWRAAMLEVRLGNPDKVIEQADAIANVVGKTCVAQGDGPSRYLRGWAIAQQGQAREGIALIRDGLERHLRIGMIASSTEVISYGVDALIAAGDWESANKDLALAFTRAREMDEHYYLPVLLIQQSRVSQGQGDDTRAHHWLREAVRIAREQEAPGFELKAANALVSHPASTPDDRAALKSLLEGLTEGRDTADHRRGMSLI
jgi:DNA-binding winged helix-turn-helix (wHTH) protein/tetratricopeptide (TPR) repeat protein